MTHNSNRRERNAYADSMETSALITMSIAGIGCLTGLIGMGFSFKADRRATRADQRAETADERAARAEEKSDRAEAAVEAADIREAWSKLINAAQHLIGANVFKHDMHPFLVDVRTSMTELIDHPSSVTYRHLDQWLDHEHKLINAHFQLANSKAPGRAMTAARFAEIHYPAIDCVDRLISNLRLVRLGLVEGDHDTLFGKLATAAKEQLEDLKGQNPGLIPPDPRATA